MQNLEFSEDIRRSDSEFSAQLSDDFTKGANLLRDIGASVAIFGSARFDSENFYYQKAKQLAKLLSDDGFHITSGGSGGIMEAANEGAYESKKSESLGFNLYLPFEQKTNRFTTRSVTLHNFCIRKKMLTKNAVACVAFPGGFGTLDEIFDTIALVQTRKILPVKLYLYGSEFWRGLVDFVKTALVEYETIASEDVEILHISDDVEEIKEGIKEYVEVYLKAMESEGLQKSERYKLIKKQILNFRK